MCVWGGETKERTRAGRWRKEESEGANSRGNSAEGGWWAVGERVRLARKSREAPTTVASLPSPLRPQTPFLSPLLSLVWWCTRSLLSCHFVLTYSSSGFPGMVILRSLPPFFSFFVAARALSLPSWFVGALSLSSRIPQIDTSSSRRGSASLVPWAARAKARKCVSVQLYLQRGA